MPRSWTLGALVVAVLVVPGVASAASHWTADSKRGDQTVSVPCPDGTSSMVTLQAAQLQYDKSFKVPLEQAQYVRVGVVGAAGGCATEMVFEVVSPRKVENFGDFDRIRCTFAAGAKGCDVQFADDLGPHGGYILDQQDGAPYFAVPIGAASSPFRLYVPMIPKIAYKTFGTPESQTSGRPRIYVYVRPAGTTGMGTSAFTSVGLWTAGGSAGADATIPRTISRAALSAGRVRIAVVGPEDTRVSITVRAGGRVVATGSGRLPVSGHRRIRLRAKRSIPASARSLRVSATIGHSGLSGRSRLTR